MLFASAFLALALQIDGLVGPHGILPAEEIFTALRDRLDWHRYFYVPSLFWLTGAGSAALRAAMWLGLSCSALLVLNVWPRAMCLACTALFLAFVAAARDFSGYQSDGMLLEAGLLSAFFAPPGLRPGPGAAHPPSRAALFLLRWEWFRIYFCSGAVKLLSGDVQWRTLTALDHYYENGPLPTFLGWYVQQGLPLWVHHASAAAVLAVELLTPWVIFLPRRPRLVIFALLTPFQILIILTANYGFLNYLVLFLGVLLLDDPPSRAQTRAQPAPLRFGSMAAALALGGFFLATLPQLRLPGLRRLPAPLLWPAASLAPFRVANGYGLFAVMTEVRDEIEFQGSLDGRAFTPYPFRFKPQRLDEVPGLHAPYQPRLDWNLWFAALGTADEYPWVATVEERLLQAEPSVLALFARDPFNGIKPREVRALRYRYRFTSRAEQRRTGQFWHRELIDEYAPPVKATPPPR